MSDPAFKHKTNFALLQAWYCIIEGGILVVLNLQFFLGKSQTTSRAWLIPLMLIQIAGLGVGNFGLSKLWRLGPWTVLAHTLLMCILTLAILPFQPGTNLISMAVPLLLHGGLAWGAWRCLRSENPANSG